MRYNFSLRNIALLFVMAGLFACSPVDINPSGPGLSTPGPQTPSTPEKEDPKDDKPGNDNPEDDSPDDGPEVESAEQRLERLFNYYLELAGDNNSHSDRTPMGQHYEGHPAATAEQKAWLADPANEPNTLKADAVKDATFQAYSNVNLYPYGFPSPADVNQQSIGDCCALAVFAHMAYVCPDFISHIIKENADGSFTVKMYDPMGNQIDVGISRQFLCNENNKLVQVWGKNKEATWATVMEKCIMKWNKVFDVDALGGIGPVAVAALFTGTGDSFGFKEGVLTAPQMKEMVETMLEKRMIMEAGFSKKDLLIGNVKTFTNHAWSVFYSIDSNALFSMRNPWGRNTNGDGNPGDGVLNIPDDGIIQPVINMRIMYPGASAPFAVKKLEPYWPPFKARP